MEKTIELIKQHRIVAIVRGVPLKSILPAAEALRKGGIRLIEVTFNPSVPSGAEDTCRAIMSLCDHFGDELCVGAGTVISTKLTELAANAGAKYIISPNANMNVIRRTNELGKVSIPGALTPTEVAAAYDAGAHFVKLFPADNLGISYIKAVRAPLSHIPLIAVGGVNDANLMDFFKAGVCGVGVGSNIVNTSLIKEGRYSELTALAEKYTKQLQEGALE